MLGSQARARPAAVLVCLYPSKGQWLVPLAVRAPGSGVHAGQIGLPGGAIEPGETSRLAALREFYEELGAVNQQIELLGSLPSIYVEVSRFLIQPWVGIASAQPQFHPNPAEVAEILEVPVGALFTAEFTSGAGERATSKGLVWGKFLIWGATLHILEDLLELLRPLEAEFVTKS